MVGHNVKPSIVPNKIAIKRKKTVVKKQKVNLRDSDVVVSPWLEDYLDCFTFKYKPITEAFTYRISKELVTWAKNDDRALKVSQFFVKKDIPAVAWHSWKKKYDVIGAAVKQAETIIADRREVGAITREYDAGTIKFLQPMYDDKWKELEEWRNEMKADINKDNQTKVVVIEKFPSSDLVPIKEAKE